MIVDSHLHLFRNGYDFGGAKSPLGPVSDIEAYEAIRGQHGIGAGLVVCYEDAGIDPANNAYVRDLAVDCPWIFSVAYLRTASSPGQGQLERLFEAGHCGIALYLPDEASALALHGWPRAIWKSLSDAHAIVSLNARPEATAHLRPILEEGAGCTFLLSHLGLPGRHDTEPTASEAKERLGPLLGLAALPNIGVKLSGLYAIDPHPPHRSARPFIDLLLERFGASRLHWGSDFSPALEFASFEETMQLECLASLSEAERELVMGKGLMARLQSP